jgi:hypothetical protein
VITTRPMDARERVEQLLIALRRVLIELPGIEEHTPGLLADSIAGRRTPIRAVRFQPMDADRARREEAHQLTWPAEPERLEQLDRVLDDLAAEVRSRE